MSRRRFTEGELIRWMRARAPVGPGVRVGIGDDCAVLEPTPGASLVATTDLLLDGIHFRSRWARPADIGWKALAVNLSDIAAMGARPRWALVAVACPSDAAPEDAEALFEELLALAARHGVAVVGGDTSISPAGWLVNVTLLGETAGPPLLRSGARIGDVVAVTGAPGRAAAGLALLDAGGDPPLPEGARDDLVGAQLRPVPRVEAGLWLARTGRVTAMADLSDGLGVDAGHLAEAGACGVELELERLPLAPATIAAGLALGAEPRHWASGGGEDYELVLTCPPGAYERLRDELLAAAGLPLTAVGRVTAAPGVRFLGPDGRAIDVPRGFEHRARQPGDLAGP